MVKALMLQGTGSDVGKSILVAGLVRAFVNRGLRVQPFKPQNMSNNAAVAKEGGEIGRAQWLQAVAARVEPSIHMNPVLLKPHSDVGAQIVVQGKVWGRADAADYQEKKQALLAAVLESFNELKREADMVVVEGAGSPAETNLRANDIANMGFATATGTPVVLVGDIDRGGVIASLVGTYAVLDARDRAMIQGFIINKFRGDVSLFDEGLRDIEHRTGWQGLGVLPWLPVIADLPAEDAVILERSGGKKAGKIKIVVPMLSRIANFDDVDPMRAEPDVEVQFIPPGTALPGDADLVIIPGSKATIADLGFFRAQGWDVDLAGHVRRGGHVLGLCAGFQILGMSVRDPLNIEGQETEAAGLGLLDLQTIINAEKTVREVEGVWAGTTIPVRAYEIHAGETIGSALNHPFLEIDGQPHGCVSRDGRIMGAYAHGLFENGTFRKAYLARLGVESDGKNQRVKVDRALDSLADAMEDALDIEGLISVAGRFPLT